MTSLSARNVGIGLNLSDGDKCFDKEGQRELIQSNRFMDKAINEEYYLC